MILFQDCNGFPVPRIGRNGNGEDRQPDGKQLWGLADAVVRFKTTVEVLREIYDSWLVDRAPGDSPPAANGGGREWWRDDVALRILHQIHFPKLNDLDFDRVMSECYRRKLNPWGKQIWAEYQWDDVRGNELMIGTTIQGFRAIAHATGECAGIEAADFSYGDDPAKPSKATVTVYRLVQGKRRAFVGRALWNERVVEGDFFWETKCHDMLEKCAEAAAHRKAFPELVGGLYERCEINASRRRGAEASANAPTDPAPADGDGEQQGPTSRFRFELELVDLGFGNPVRRTALIEGFRAKHPKLFNDDPPAFYSTVLKAVRENPGAYGDPPAQENGEAPMSG